MARNCACSFDLILGVCFLIFSALQTFFYKKNGYSVYRQWVPCNYSFLTTIFVNLFIGPDLSPNCLIVFLQDCLVFIFVNV